jgi:single-strand DNA-binding protein
MLNRVTIEGRLATEPQGRITASGRNVVSFALAVPRRKSKDGEDRPPNFFRIIGWGPQADFAMTRLKKGRLISIDGRVEQRSYVDEKGIKREIVEIIASTFNPLDAPPQADSQ